MSDQNLTSTPAAASAQPAAAPLSTPAPSKPMSLSQIRAEKNNPQARPTTVQSPAQRQATPAAQQQLGYVADEAQPANIDNGGDPSGDATALIDAAAQDAQGNTQDEEQGLVDEAAQDAQDAIDYRAKYEEWLNSGDLAEDFHDKLVAVPLPGGGEEHVTVKELQKGHMRRADHSRAMNETAKVRNEAAQVVQENKNLWNMLKSNPAQTLEILSEQCGDEFMTKVYEHRHQQVTRIQDTRMAAGVAAALKFDIPLNQAANDPRVLQAMDEEENKLARLDKLERDAAKREKADREAQAQRQQEANKGNNDEFIKKFHTNVKRFGPAALTAEGISVNSTTLADLKYKIASVMTARNEFLPESEQSSDVTLEVVREAVQVYKEELLDKRRAANGVTTPSTPLQRQGMGGGSGKVQPIASNKPMSLSQIKALSAQQQQQQQRR